MFGIDIGIRIHAQGSIHQKPTATGDADSDDKPDRYRQHVFIRHPEGCRSVREYRRMCVKKLSCLSSILLSVALVCCSCGTAASSSANRSLAEVQQLKKRYMELRRQEEALTLENSVAKDSDPYLVVDLSNRSFGLKARGRYLRYVHILDSKTEGIGNASNMLWTLADRKTLAELERPKITPGAGEDATVEAAQKGIWGPARMPADYDLICHGGTVLQIRSLPAKESSNRVHRGIVSTYRRSLEWFRGWHMPGSSNRPHTIRLWLVEDDARLIFWSLPRQIQILILRGSDLP
jgi:hypothetical protein